ncbi:MAG: hypothetical protein V1729_02260 [Candidatus Woesearchaeota archaeon]
MASPEKIIRNMLKEFNPNKIHSNIQDEEEAFNKEQSNLMKMQAAILRDRVIQVCEMIFTVYETIGSKEALDRMDEAVIKELDHRLRGEVMLSLEHFKEAIESDKRRNANAKTVVNALSCMKTAIEEVQKHIDSYVSDGLKNPKVTADTISQQAIGHLERVYRYIEKAVVSPLGSPTIKVQVEKAKDRAMNEILKAA